MTERNDDREQMPLGTARRGYSGVIQHLVAGDAASALSDHELESRLIELGVVEGARDGVLARSPGAARAHVVLCGRDRANLRWAMPRLYDLMGAARRLVAVPSCSARAPRRGVSVDVPGLSEGRGGPVVTSIAVRKG